jgi:hypothetical protein
MQQRRIECPQKKMNCLVATYAAKSLTTASACAHTAEEVLVATAAQATVEQQADKKQYSSPTKSWL